MADLRADVHQQLCAKENLLQDQFALSEAQLVRRSRPCGLQFLLQGPRSVRLGAIWASDTNMLYFYDACGERFAKLKLTSRIHHDEMPAEPEAAA